MDTVIIVDGRRDDPQARTLVFHLPRDGQIIDALCQEQRIYRCGAAPVIEDGCGRLTRQGGRSHGEQKGDDDGGAIDCGGLRCFLHPS
jgi:hypothetical protein